MAIASMGCELAPEAQPLAARALQHSLRGRSEARAKAGRMARAIASEPRGSAGETASLGRGAERTPRAGGGSTRAARAARAERAGAEWPPDGPGPRLRPTWGRGA